ncbi:HAD family hydrolase [Treponema sp. OttesenSCG-928-L16]|nr:HAD family hydrolase [Treponema sp. OttesenSCG-928-L16]
MKYKCVIFDLDGTLVDTIGDIAASMNHALAARSAPAHTPEEYLRMVGWGMRRLAYQALPPDDRDEQAIDAVVAGATSFYAEHPFVYAKPYPGIPELIAALKMSKVRTAVLTNKPDPVAQLVIAGLFPKGSFDIVQGDRPDIKRKPDPAGCWDIMMELDANSRNSIIVGDSEIDIETAKAAGCHGVGVSWGFRGREVLEKAGADRIVDHPDEILSLIRDTRL